MSTMLLDWSTGVSGLGLFGTAEQSGMTNLVRFSYKANSLNIFEGDGPATADFEFAEAYATIFLELSLLTSYK